LRKKTERKAVGFSGLGQRQGLDEGGNLLLKIIGTQEKEIVVLVSEILGPEVATSDKQEGKNSGQSMVSRRRE